jgi:hypothetical protein
MTKSNQNTSGIPDLTGAIEITINASMSPANELQAESRMHRLSDSFAEYNKLRPSDFSSLEDFVEQWKLDAREPFLRDSSEPLCPHCKMPEMSCICSQYDSEGNKL